MQQILIALIVLAALAYLVWTCWPRRSSKGTCACGSSCDPQRTGRGLAEGTSAAASGSGSVVTPNKFGDGGLGETRKDQ